ncbi:MAG: Sec-independent protein translocase protein TatB [Pseudomonadota bacterium]|nr:Sec-independent protein translocase protein TatB [Pseudomonadota bacterium]
MLDFGFSEILLTSAIALVVLGPERLPKVARQVGNWMGRARAMARQLSEQLEREVSAEEFLREQGKPKTPPENRIGPPQPGPPQAAPPQYLAPEPPGAPPTRPLDGPDMPSTDPHFSPSGVASKPPNE